MSQTPLQPAQLSRDLNGLSAANRRTEKAAKQGIEAQHPSLCQCQTSQGSVGTQGPQRGAESEGQIVPPALTWGRPPVLRRMGRECRELRPDKCSNREAQLGLTHFEWAFGAAHPCCAGGAESAARSGPSIRLPQLMRGQVLKPLPLPRG